MQFKRNLKHIFAILCITFLSLIGVMRFFGAGISVPITHFFIYRENVPVLNWLYKYTFTPSKDIVIIKIDDATLNTLQAESDLKMLTIEKSLYISLIEKLNAIGVKGVGFDIVFQNKDPQEKLFADILSNTPNIVIATTQGNNQECKKDKNDEYETCEGVPRSVYKGALWGNIDTNSFGDRKQMISDISSLPYATWRKSPEVYTIALALYKASSGSMLSVSYPKGESVLTPFFGVPGVYQSISLHDMMSMSKLDLIANFAGKYIFIGESGTIIHDQFISPVSGTFMDGVESHAHFLDGLLQHRKLIGYDNTHHLFFLSLIVTLITMCLVYMLTSKYVSLSISIFVTIFLIWIGRFLYFTYGIVLEIFPFFLAGSLFTFPITFIYRFFIVDREKRILTSAFAHYVDPEVVREISSKAHTIKLGGESRELSILFSDIAGFTTLSEKTPVAELFMIMSSYLSRMTTILTDHGGTLDKYIGDAVMGFFGAPLTLDDHARRACQTALDMRKALPAFNAELISRGLEAIDFRVGIGTGEVLVGNIGSHNRFNYTVLGDTVNLASRLESTSKEYGTHILVSEPTYLATREEFFFRKLDLITVKGKTEAVGIYELIANISDSSIDTRIYEKYSRALDLYMGGQYLKAGKIWESQMHLDPPSRIMAERCLSIMRGEIAIEGGVYHMTKK